MLFPLLSMGAVNSVMFGVYGNRLRALQSTCETPREKERLLLQHVFLAGTAGGLVQSFLACPAELIKIKLQTHKCECNVDYRIDAIKCITIIPQTIDPLRRKRFAATCATSSKGTVSRACFADCRLR